MGGRRVRRRVHTRRVRYVQATIAAFAGGVGAVGPTSEIATTPQATVVSALAVLSVTALAVYRILHMAIVLSPGLVTIRGLCPRSPCALQTSSGSSPHLPTAPSCGPACGWSSSTAVS